MNPVTMTEPGFVVYCMLLILLEREFIGLLYSVYHDEMTSADRGGRG